MIIDCASIAVSLDNQIRSIVQDLRARGIVPRMCEVLATGASAALSYSKTKERKAKELGIEFEALHFSKDVHIGEILNKAAELNRDRSVHGVMIGMPTFSHIDGECLLSAIAANKDIDGLGPTNSYYLYSNQEHLAIAPATATAALCVLEGRGGVAGKRVSVIGRGRTVGRPLAAMLSNRDATVSICHSRTPRSALQEVIQGSDVVISATGTVGVVESSWFREGQVVIDCGISYSNGRVVGDVNAAEVSARGASVTPVPKGVGVVTNSTVFSNLLRGLSLEARDGN